jgi:hypothetical protein
MRLAGSRGLARPRSYRYGQRDANGRPVRGADIPGAASGAPTVTEGSGELPAAHGGRLSRWPVLAPKVAAAAAPAAVIKSDP